MREVNVNIIEEKVSQLSGMANFELPEDVLASISRAELTETDEGARDILGKIKENAARAKEDRLPLCQDCGVTNIFLEIGQDVHFTGGGLEDAVHSGVRKAYRDNYLRKSILNSPLLRENTRDNTPALIHYSIVPGEKVKLTVMPKGGGCENKSFINMLNPGDGVQGVKRFVVECVSSSGSSPCPPIVIGIGIGGNFEHSAIMAKKSLLRELGSPNPVPRLQSLEEEILEAVNKLGIGPQGFGGKTTALGVHILEAPCHIASLPVAVNIECHSHRHKEVEI